MFDIVIRRGDTLPKIQKKFYVNGAAFDITGYDIVFIVNDLEGGEQLNHTAEIVDAVNGIVAYQWTNADSTAVTADIVFARFQATAGSNILTVPNNRPLSMTLTDIGKNEYSYSGDPAGRPIDRIRFLLSDTNMDRPLFTDKEIQFLLDEYTNPYAAASEAASIQASKYTTLANKTVGPLSIDYGQLSSRWTQLARNLSTRFVGSGGGAVAITTQKNVDPYFRTGIMDNPEINKPPAWQDITGTVQDI